MDDMILNQSEADILRQKLRHSERHNALLQAALDRAEADLSKGTSSKANNVEDLSANSRARTGGWSANGFFWSRKPPRMTNKEIDDLINYNRQLLEHQLGSQQHADELSSTVTRLETKLKQVREGHAKDLQKLRDMNKAVESPRLTNKEIDELIHHNRQLLEHQRRSQQHADKLSSMVTRMETELKQGHAFVASETSADAKNLLQKLRDINEAVDDFAFNLLQHPMLKEELESPLTPSMCRNAFALIEGDLIRLCVNFANFALSNRMTIRQYIQPLTQMLFLHFLLTVVFTPFIPGLAAKESKPIEKLFKQISETEPQDRSARWRAITYSRGFPGRDDQVIVRDCSHALLRTLHAVLFSCIQKVQKESYGPDDFRWMESLEVIAQTITQDAIKWQDRAKTSHLSYEYIPTFTINSSFDPTHMLIEENGWGRAEGQPKADENHALLCVGFGLLAVKTVLAPDGKALNKEEKQVIKTKVVCGKLITVEGS